MTVSELFWSQKGHEAVENVHETLTERSCKRSGTMNSCNAERSGTLEPGRSNALERIVKNVLVQKRKQHWNLTLIDFKNC